MNKTSIEFISTQGKLFEENMQLIKDYFVYSKGINPEFAFYIKPNNKRNKILRKGVLLGRKAFCKKINNSFCVDASLPKKLNKKAKKANRILLAAPNDFPFKVVNSINVSANQKDRFNSFNYVVTGSDFQRKLFENTYNTKATIINDIMLPYNYELKKGEKTEIYRKKIEYYYPEIKNKKIITILTSNRKSNDAVKINNFNLKGFIDRLDSDCFVFTNSKFLLENANELSNKYINRFAFINKHLPIGDLLYFTDCLITNQPNYATAFSATEKNLFCLSQINNNLEKYMKKEFPKLYIDNMNSFDITKLLSNELSNEFKKVSKLFNVQSDKNPYEVIADIIKKDS